MSGGRDARSLRALLERLDGRGYRAYRQIEGAWDLGHGWTLHVDHVQPDPFAPPSRLRLELGSTSAGYEGELLGSPVRCLAACDLLLRRLASALSDHADLSCTVPGPEILERTDLWFHEGRLFARCTARLPAGGRRIRGLAAARLLLEALPRAARATLPRVTVDSDRLREHVEGLEDQRALRAALDRASLVAFLADGSLLPRESGVSGLPLRGPDAVALRAPDSLAVELDAPYSGRLRGLGLPRGVTLVCGGAFHGKSTLLEAVAMGVHDHVPGDGRERCVTRADATLHRAEPGRWVDAIDIRPFLGPLPGGADTARFATTNASGSTSQAASILEGLEAGSRLLLFDEDTSAGNLLAQDPTMRALLGEGGEPIIHLSRRLRQLKVGWGVSTVLVLGGSAAAFDQADRVIQMVDFRPQDVTRRARELAAGAEPVTEPSDWPPIRPRQWKVASVQPGDGRRPVRVRIREPRELELGRHRADLRAWTQLVDPAQLRAVGAAIGALVLEYGDRAVDLPELLEQLGPRLDRSGMERIRCWAPGELARPRVQDVLAALVRLRGSQLGVRDS